jgi:hypothetical protein
LRESSADIAGLDRRLLASSRRRIKQMGGNTVELEWVGLGDISRESWTPSRLLRRRPPPFRGRLRVPATPCVSVTSDSAAIHHSSPDSCELNPAIHHSKVQKQFDDGYTAQPRDEVPGPMHGAREVDSNFDRYKLGLRGLTYQRFTPPCPLLQRRAIGTRLRDDLRFSAESSKCRNSSAGRAHHS